MLHPEADMYLIPEGIGHDICIEIGNIYLPCGLCVRMISAKYNELYYRGIYE